MNAFLRLYIWFRRRFLGVDDRSSFKQACDNGMTVGKDCSIQDGVLCDPSHAWLITIGDRVTIAPRVMIFAHDASSKNMLGYSMIGRVNIGNDVFIGAGSIILPGVDVGDNVIIGAGSVVKYPIPAGYLAAGNPARIICSTESFIAKRSEQIKSCHCYDESFLLNSITNLKKEQMRKDLAESNGFII